MADINYNGKIAKIVINYHYLSSIRAKSNIVDSKVMHPWSSYVKVKKAKDKIQDGGNTKMAPLQN